MKSREEFEKIDRVNRTGQKTHTVIVDKKKKTITIKNLKSKEEITLNCKLPEKDSEFKKGYTLTGESSCYKEVCFAIPPSCKNGEKFDLASFHFGENKLTYKLSRALADRICRKEKLVHEYHGPNSRSRNREQKSQQSQPPSSRYQQHTRSRQNRLTAPTQSIFNSGNGSSRNQATHSNSGSNLSCSRYRQLEESKNNTKTSANTKSTIELLLETQDYIAYPPEPIIGVDDDNKLNLKSLLKDGNLNLTDTFFQDLALYRNSIFIPSQYGFEWNNDKTELIRMSNTSLEPILENLKSPSHGYKINLEDSHPIVLVDDEESIKHLGCCIYAELLVALYEKFPTLSEESQSSAKLSQVKNLISPKTISKEPLPENPTSNRCTIS